MNKGKWKSTIKKACQDAGTYKPFFDQVIDTLASILERRDSTEELFIKSGGNTIITHTNKSGATNIEQHPAVRLINDLNRDALSYWRDLGLTPAGYRKLNADVIDKKESGSLEKILETIML